MDLIHLEDADGDHCTVRVTGRFRPGVLSGHDVLRADVLAHAGFVDAGLELSSSRTSMPGSRSVPRAPCPPWSMGRRTCLESRR
ncbi:DUF5959 family protein [Streptomyces sp. NPDC060000]|uniref:DUF5959 family protein n=1 Tax=Streptomyces sp. NPDC060000 TaxID=3347031 RepID=UPI0036BDF69D